MEVVFVNGVKNHVEQYVEDFKVTVEKDSPVNEPKGTIVNFFNQEKT